MNERGSEWLRRERQYIKDVLSKATGTSPVRDIAFIGNASDLYEWEPAAIIDFDVCFIVDQLDSSLGDWLWRLRTNLTESMLVRGIVFELRLIRGTYKKEITSDQRPSFVVHLSVFTEQEYLQRPQLLRWGWRKYKCLSGQTRFERLAPPRPSSKELMHGRGGIIQKLETIHSGTAPLVELLLPDLSESRWTTVYGEPLFNEYCLSAVAVSARNHARIMGFAEADYLSNREFAQWYVRHLLQSPELLEAMELKSLVRMVGYESAAFIARHLAVRYLSCVAVHISPFSER